MAARRHVEPDGAPAAWRATGFAPSITFDLTAEARPGWYALEIGIQAGHDLQVRVLPGFGGRFERTRSTVLKRDAGGIFVGTFRAPEPFRQIEVEPGRLPGPFRLERLVLRRMGPFAVASMALAGAVRAARRGPGPLAGYLKAALATVLNPRRFETAQPPGGGGEGSDDAQRRYAAWLDARTAPDPAEQSRPPAPIVVIVPILDAVAADAVAATLGSLAGQVRRFDELVLAGPADRLAAADAALATVRASGCAARIATVPVAGGATAAATVTAGVEASAAAAITVLPPGWIADPGLVGAFAAEAETAETLALAYADEDETGPDGHRRHPRFKPSWSPALLESHAYMGVPLLIARSCWPAEAARLRSGAEPYDLAFRVTEAAPPGAIRRVAQTVASRRDDGPVDGWSPATAAERAAAAVACVADHLARRGEAGRVVPVSGHPGFVRVRRALPSAAPLVSVIVPTRDRADLIGACLAGLAERTDYPALEILVVDNGSVDPDALAVLEAAAGRPGIRLLRAPGPFDYAGLNNRAAAAARGEILCLLNDDVVPIGPDWLAAMVGEALQADVGPVGATLLYPDGTVQHAGILLGMHGTAGHMDRGLPGDAAGPGGRLLARREVAAVTGACLVVRKAVWDRLGGFDPAFAVAFNDVDFCLRARALGLRTVITPDARLTHFESASRGADREGARRARFEAEAARFRARWAASVLDDPIVSPSFDRAEGAFAVRAAEN
ncbi:glycosyltransferase family 2 protein [Prosthecodimorpha staleyi]|uniref:Glycosyltransferase n=1 Tax=Prosthecodimorpha staleyi TaxID=2840188 RepID=A0A947GFW1_9HYPH|nr:glycosyltransferase [Prosthecodimorpha staleyi]MBT9291080.1 glycosyltransferase [Prosthecodimorpha staleyi]